MAISTNARFIRIDNKVIDINKRAQSLIAQLQGVIKEARLFTAFMHDNQNMEFDQVDRDKYSDMFAETISAPDGLLGCISLVTPMTEVEQGTKTPEDFVLEESAYNSDSYSKRFDVA